MGELPSSAIAKLGSSGAFVIEDETAGQIRRRLAAWGLSIGKTVLMLKLNPLRTEGGDVVQEEGG
jgi:hypothetical protein